MVTSMNKAMGPNMLPESRLDRVFERWWPDLETVLESLSKRKDERATPRRSERDLLEELLALQRRNDQRELAPEIAKHILRQIWANGPLKRPEKERPSHELEVMGAESVLKIDTKPLVGIEGGEFLIRYPVFGSVSDLLDEIYRHVIIAVPMSSFGRIWALRERGTGKVFTDMGRTWAKTVIGSDLDSRPLEEVGIRPGMELECIHLPVE